MADTHETIADIIAEMRIFKCRNLETGELESCNAIANYLADRLEAAHRREADYAREAYESALKAEREALREQYEAGALVDGTRGDSAKLREALKSIWKEVYLYAIEEDKQDFAHLHESMLENPPEYKDLRNSFFAIAHLVDAALAAPPRNCDRFGSSTQARAEWYKTEVLPRVEGVVSGVEPPFVDWLFAPATEKEGGNDGR